MTMYVAVPESHLRQGLYVVTGIATLYRCVSPYTEIPTHREMDLSIEGYPELRPTPLNSGHL
jgi:hypothetical protein